MAKYLDRLFTWFHGLSDREPSHCCFRLLKGAATRKPALKSRAIVRWEVQESGSEGLRVSGRGRNGGRSR